MSRNNRILILPSILPYTKIVLKNVHNAILPGGDSNKSHKGFIFKKYRFYVKTIWKKSESHDTITYDPAKHDSIYLCVDGKLTGYICLHTFLICFC